MGRLSDEQYRDRALGRRFSSAELSFDANALVSRGEQGAFVQCWIYVPDVPEYLDEDGMAVDLTEYLDENENPFEHQSGPNGCPSTCPACGWEALTGKTEEA